MTQEIKPKYRIGDLMSFMMVGIACIFWGIQVLCSLTGVGEIVSWMVGLGQDIFFFLWFIFLGINYFQGNVLEKFGITIGCDIVELIPFINDVPAMVIQVVSLILISRREDMNKAKMDAAAADKATREHAAIIRFQLEQQQHKNEQMRREYEAKKGRE